MGLWIHKKEEMHELDYCVPSSYVLNKLGDLRSIYT